VKPERSGRSDVVVSVPRCGLLGWIFLFVTSGWHLMLYSLLALARVVAFLVWSKNRESWPFADKAAV